MLSAFNVYKGPILQNFKSCKSCVSGSWQTFQMAIQGFDAMFINILTRVLHILPRVPKENVWKWMTFLVQPFVKCCLVTRYFLKVSFMFQDDKTIQRCKSISEKICWSLFGIHFLFRICYEMSAKCIWNDLQWNMNIMKHVMIRRKVWHKEILNTNIGLDKLNMFCIHEFPLH